MDRRAACAPDAGRSDDQRCDAHPIFALHVFIIPGTLLAFTGLHVWMVLKLGINEWPMPGRIVRRETYIEEYHELTHTDGIPFVPGAVWKDLVFSAAILFAVACCAAVFGPYGPKGVPDPTIINTVPKPDFFFCGSIPFFRFCQRRWKRLSF